MAALKNKKNVFVKSVSTKKQANMDHITGDKIPMRFVFSRCKLPGPLKQLQADLRKLVLPYTAFKLKEKRRNNLRDFFNVAGPMGVTHFLMLSKTPIAPYLSLYFSDGLDYWELRYFYFLYIFVGFFLFRKMSCQRVLFLGFSPSHSLSLSLSVSLLESGVHTLYAMDREWIRN
ncbi:peter Pan-like protein [Pyrus ussuriensis x Pyrus communis]|uniref:Peter Pan-like protein n=1 Tax=Pyrus ussuriensis x Pyrus communis TaxID=2448454 RepID=A0A5N5HI81_9ROSA|nr:peter Pan-like protein [Pyrus ussuriensis x Pyrus communis]